MNDVKLRLSLYVPGAQMLSSQTCEENVTENYDRTKIEVRTSVSGKKKDKTEVITVSTRKSRLVRQNINLTSDAFNYMVSNETPYFSTIKEWKNKSRKERLKEHLDRIAENFNAKSYTFEILDD